MATANLTPTSKMTAAGSTGLAAVALVWTLAQFGIEMPETVAGAFVFGIAWLAGYLKTERRPVGKHVAR